MAQAAPVLSFSFGEGNTKSGIISDSFNNIFAVNPADEKLEPLQWLSPLVPGHRHLGVRDSRHESVGNWLLETNEFRKWSGGEGGADKAVLFCSGEPGVGKTYLSSLVIDSLCERPSKEDTAVAILYCNYQEQHKQTTTNIIGAILKQLAVKDDSIRESVRNAFLRAKDECGGQGPCLPDLVRMLKESIASLRQVFICIDALDELVQKELPGLLVLLGGIVQERPNVCVFLTGRPNVESQIKIHFTKVVMIPVSPKPHDIRSYLDWKLRVDPESHEMSDDLRRSIARIIGGSLSKSFLLVSLSIDAILEEATAADRRKKLEQISKGDGLGDAYALTLERVKAQKGQRTTFAMKALIWVAYSERPLQSSELCHALGVTIGPTDLNGESAPAIETLLGWSLGLIMFEKSSATVRLVHFTLQDYLSKTLTLLASPHSMIAETCLTYLNSESVCTIPPPPFSSRSTMPLLDYASCYWEKHARRGMTQNVKQLVLSLLSGFDQHISSRILLRNGDYPIRLWRLCLYSEQDRFMGFTCLHWTASLGMLETTSALLEMKKWDFNVTDAAGKTAIAWAARGGHTAILKKLLEQENTDPNIPDKYGSTPLSWAAWRGDKEVVDILLNWRDINLDPVHRDGRTPLLWAVSRGHEEVVKLLLKHKDAAFNLALSERTPVAFLTKPLIIQILIDCSAISASLCLLVFLSWIIPTSPTILLSFRR